MKIIDIWINCPSRQVAEQIADTLIARRLAACANIYGEIHSIYRWHDKIEKETEVPLLLKSRAALFERIVEEVGLLHPYETPSIIGVPVELVNSAYRDWVIKETG